jgi:uncharacterized protein YktA (UPF0223 family)
VAKIAYGANRSRYIRKDIQNNEPAKVTYYLGSVEYIYENNEVKARMMIGSQKTGYFKRVVRSSVMVNVFMKQKIIGFQFSRQKIY